MGDAAKAGEVAVQGPTDLSPRDASAIPYSTPDDASFEARVREVLPHLDMVLAGIVRRSLLLSVGLLRQIAACPPLLLPVYRRCGLAHQRGWRLR